MKMFTPNGWKLRDNGKRNPIKSHNGGERKTKIKRAALYELPKVWHDLANVYFEEERTIERLSRKSFP